MSDVVDTESPIEPKKDTPEELISKIKEELKNADSDGDGVPDAKGVFGLLKKLSSRDGEFSKTALFASLGNALVLVNYVLLSWLGGSAFAIGPFTGTIPAFNSTDALTIIGVLNATYVVNKKKDAAPVT
jgi:hypothetical protein